MEPIELANTRTSSPLGVLLAMVAMSANAGSTAVFVVTVENGVAINWGLISWLTITFITSFSAFPSIVSGRLLFSAGVPRVPLRVVGWVVAFPAATVGCRFASLGPIGVNAVV